jgi:hypothetical protein
MAYGGYRQLARAAAAELGKPAAPFASRPREPKLSHNYESMSVAT